MKPSGLLTLGLAALVATRALAFVPQRTSTGKAVMWKAARVYLTPDRDTPGVMTSDQFRQEIIQAAANWTDRSNGNSYLSIEVDATTDVDPAADDYRNVVAFLKDCWGRKQGNDCVPFSPDAPALTFLVFVNNPSSARYGEIVDADIELNAVDPRFRWGILTPGGETPGVIDLQNTLTHEIGHLIGFDHNCYTGSASTVILDHADKAIPSCRNPTPSIDILDATMYAFTLFAETKKRTIEPDDVLALWSTYPTAKNPGTYSRVLPVVGGTEDTGCSFAAAQPKKKAGTPRWLLAMSMAVTLFALRRRSRRRT